MRTLRSSIFRRFARPLIGCLAVFTAIALLSATMIRQTSAASSKDAAPQTSDATFPGTGVGAIPDGLAGTPPQYGAPLVISFAVSGVTAPITNLSVSLTLTHTWCGDLDMVLAAPGGSPNQVVVGHIGVTAAGSFGSSSDYNGSYNFTDSASGTNIWTAAAATPIPPGNYRTTVRGMAGTTNPPLVTSLNSTFGGLTTPQANGVWTLTIRDGANGDTGTVTAASLNIINPQHVVDFDGDGKTDFSVVRNTSPGTTEQLTWYTQRSAGGFTSTPWGTATTDFLVPEDYDGDGKTDIAVWRPGPPFGSYFYILQSMSGTLRTEQFGQTGDDPAVVGDYDGDRKADVAVYRCPPVGSPGQCFFFYRGSNANPMGIITFVPWGFGQQFDFFPLIGDFDGDGKNDFCIQRTLPGAAPAGQFVLLRSSDGGVEYVAWGLNNDIIVPGDYDGDGRDDFCVSRTETVFGVPGRSYYVLERDGGGTGGNPIRWGVAGDIRAPGDYDGDGKTDFAVWRPSPAPATFYVRRSSDFSLQQFQWGLVGDGAVATWSVH